jgi:threonine synthase
VVVISTAHGLKFTEFKTRYHADALPVPAKYANAPVPMGSDPDEVVAALHRILDRRPGAS